MKRIRNLYKNAYSGLSPATLWLSLVMLINRSGTMVVPFMTLYLTQTKHYSIGKSGIVMAIFGAGAICGGFIGGKLTDKLGFYNIQLTSLLCGGVLFIILGQLENFNAICACTFVLATLNESFRPANATAIAQYSNESNRTRCYSLNRLSINLGWAFGGALGGFIASHNYQLIFWIDGFTNIGAAALLVAVLSPSKNSQTPPITGDNGQTR
jgi:predicted MFS family arabinose efflux permease